MTEQLLQFIWQFRYFNMAELTTTAGEPLEIIHPGKHNTNQGPDFLNAKIKCGDTLLAGNIEVHVQASEWSAHRHSEDKNYNNVILHVVLQEDQQLNLPFPVLELGGRISKLLSEKYETLLQAQRFIPCEAYADKINDLTLLSWKERLLTERLQEKAASVQKILEKNNYHWEETFWQVLAKNFGASINSDAFECIAASLPLTLLAKHRSRLHQLEALLMGQAGLLDEKFRDDYPIMLQKEYRFLKKKYTLRSPAIALHFLRMRPANFPTVRLAQLAMLIHESSALFSFMINAKALEDVMKKFEVTANDYWHYRYCFDEPSAYRKKTLGAQMIRSIMMNTVLPVMYTYGWYHNSEGYKAGALNWAAALPPENNKITGGFEKLGMANRSAADSQALIQLKNKYCNEKRCLECAIGNQILKAP